VAHRRAVDIGLTLQRDNFLPLFVPMYEEVGAVTAKLQAFIIQTDGVVGGDWRRTVLAPSSLQLFGGRTGG